MRRIQLYIEEEVDDALQTMAARRGLSKAAVIREAVHKELPAFREADEDPWKALIGTFHGDPVTDIDAVIYEEKAT